jgi:hypothetical protein
MITVDGNKEGRNERNKELYKGMVDQRRIIMYKYKKRRQAMEGREVRKRTFLFLCHVYFQVPVLTVPFSLTFRVSC